jgi:hypothetical protein
MNRDSDMVIQLGKFCCDIEIWNLREDEQYIQQLES